MASPGRESWTEVLPHRAGRDAGGGRLLPGPPRCSSSARTGSPRCGSPTCGPATAHRIAFPEAAYTACAGGEPRVRHPDLPLQLPVAGDAAVRLRLRHGRPDRDAAQGAAGARRLRPPRLRDRARAAPPRRTASKVPVSIVYRRGLVTDGSAPLYLYGYGSYGFPLPVTFSSNRLSLLDRGVVVALAHVRGGGEMGKPWHDDGRHDEEAEHLHRLRRLRRAPARRGLRRAATGWSSRAAARAGC